MKGESVPQSGHFSLGSTDMMLLPEAVPINQCVPVAHIEMKERNLSQGSFVGKSGTSQCVYTNPLQKSKGIRANPDPSKE